MYHIKVTVSSTFENVYPKPSSPSLRHTCITPTTRELGCRIAIEMEAPNSLSSPTYIR